MKTETLDISQPELRLDDISTPDYVEIHGTHQDDDRMLVECWRWYLPDFERIALLFEKAAEAAAKDGFSQDDYAVALEIGKNHPFVISEWKYNKTKDKGIESLAIDASVRYGKPGEI